MLVPLFRDFIAAFRINEKPCFEDDPRKCGADFHFTIYAAARNLFDTTLSLPHNKELWVSRQTTKTHSLFVRLCFFQKLV